MAFRLEFGERVRWLLDRFRNRSEAAEVAAVTPEHLASYIGGRAKPPFELVARLARTQGVSLDWLASGEGQPTMDDGEPEGFALITVRDSDVAAGEAHYGSESDPAPLAFSRAWLKASFGAAEDDLRAVIHRGNANEPAIRDGDLLLVDIRARQIGEDGFYVFERDGRLQTKLVETYLDGRVALKARNPEFSAQILTRDEAARLALLGRVRWRSGAI